MGAGFPALVRQQAAEMLANQVEEIGVASHESLDSEQRGGGHKLVLFGVPVSMSGQEPGVSAPDGPPCMCGTVCLDCP